MLVGAPAGYSLTTLPPGIEEGAALGAAEMDQRGGHALGEPDDGYMPGDGDMPLGDAWTTIPNLIAIGVLACEEAHSAS